MLKFCSIILFLTLLGCSYFNKKEEKKFIARVGDKYLYLDDIKQLVDNKVSSEDSLLLINNYIQKWVKENLLLQKAELNLTDQQKDFKKQLEDYKKSLIIYSYEQKLVKQKLDTNISEEEINQYYKDESQNFELKNDIVKVRYLKLSKNAPIKKIRKIYQSNKLKDLIKLNEYAHQYSERFFLNDSLWILFDELESKMPLKVADTENYLKSINHIEVEDSSAYYLVCIKDYKLKGSLAPLSFESKNIKSIILNKRKLGLIKKVQNELYQDAILNKQIEIKSKISEAK